MKFRLKMIFIFWSWGCSVEESDSIEAMNQEAMNQEAMNQEAMNQEAMNQEAIIISPNEIITEVIDREILNSFEKDYGFSPMMLKLNDQAELTEFTNQRNTNNWTIQNSPHYSLLTAHLSDRIKHITEQVKRPLITELKDALAYPAGNVGRQFDNRWFESDIAHFQLAGIINRLDKSDFNTGLDCGEIRFVYRLGYLTKDGIGSQLPLTLNLVFEEPLGECSQAIKYWIKPKEGKETTFEWLKDDALNLSRLRLKQIEVNAQIIRFPSGLETEFAGQAIYLLRVYGFDQSDGEYQLKEVPLENTPDVVRLQKEPEIKERLINWIGQNTKSIDLGVYKIPDEYLTVEALSYSTLGINRSANKPFDALFQPEDFKAIPKHTRWINSNEALIDRLNNGSCMGCHQASTTAGFHFLGPDDPQVVGITNRLELPFSSHFNEELLRRKEQLSDRLSGIVEPSFRPHSLATPSKDPKSNDNCIPEEQRQLFKDTSDWSCKEKESCQVTVNNMGSGVHFGQCIPLVENIESGQVCKTGTVQKSPHKQEERFNLHSYDDIFIQAPLFPALEDNRINPETYTCRPTRIGVPLGRTYRKCAPQEITDILSSSEPPSEEICAIVGGAKFDSCVEVNFHDCLDSIVSRGVLDSCHMGRFCREDYICQELPYQLKGIDDERGRAIQEAGIGFCTPTYFVFQLRLDGHPTP
jgi:hypothetical protein